MWSMWWANRLNKCIVLHLTGFYFNILWKKYNCCVVFDIDHGKFDSVVNSKHKIEFLKDQRTSRVLKLDSLIRGKHTIPHPDVVMDDVEIRYDDRKDAKMSNYNRSLTYSEKEKQKILQIVDWSSTIATLRRRRIRISSCRAIFIG